MKYWVPIAIGSLIAFAYAFFYILGTLESGGGASLWLANVVGLAAVFIGLVAAGFLLRRATPPA